MNKERTDGAMHLAYLSLGANIGDRIEAIDGALAMIAAIPGVHLLRVSALYATEPVGYRDQPEFINAAAVVETELGPELLLDRLRAIELELGRVRRARWREREIDIDIILFDDLVVQTERLRIPHPEMQHRAFVLVPLAAIAPHVPHPLLGATVAELLARLEDCSGVISVGRSKALSG